MLFRNFRLLQVPKRPHKCTCVQLLAAKVRKNGSAELKLTFLFSPMVTIIRSCSTFLLHSRCLLFRLQRKLPPFFHFRCSCGTPATQVAHLARPFRPQSGHKSAPTVRMHTTEFSLLCRPHSAADMLKHSAERGRHMGKLCGMQSQGERAFMCVRYLIRGRMSVRGARLA